MITNAFYVKEAHGEYDGISESQPDVNFDTTMGYYVDFRLLVTDGTNWICKDATAAAAVWEQDTTDDLRIKEVVRALTESLSIYLNNWFIHEDDSLWITGLQFVSPASILWAEADTNGFLSSFFPGDTLWVTGSRRNDGVYDIDTVANDTLTLRYDIKQPMVEANNVRLDAAIYPDGLQKAAGALGAYDVWDRQNRPTGLLSESIGSYSYSVDETTVDGMAYPDDLVQSLYQWKRPRVSV